MGVPSCTVAKRFHGDSGAEAGAQLGVKVVGGSSRGTAPRGRGWASQAGPSMAGGPSPGPGAGQQGATPGLGRSTGSHGAPEQELL